MPERNKRIILIEAGTSLMDFYLEELREALERATSGMTADQLERRPGEKWSAAEILEHLSLTYSGTVKGLEKCMASGKPLATSPTLKHRVAEFVVVGLGHMPKGRKAPERSVPRGMPGSEALRALRENLGAMDEAIARCEQRFGEKVKIMHHPFLGPLSITGWKKFHWVHGRPHARQIEKL